MMDTEAAVAEAIGTLREYTHLALDEDREFDDPEEWFLSVAEAFRTIDNHLISKGVWK